MLRQKRRVLSRAWTSAVIAAVLALVASSSHTRLRAAGDAPTTYATTFSKTVVLTVPITDGVSIDTGLDPAGSPGLVATFPVADITNLSEGTWGNVVVECGGGLPCDDASQGGPAGTGYPIQGIIFSVTPAPGGGLGGTVRVGLTGNVPSPLALAGKRFDSTLYFPGNGSSDAAGDLYMADSYNNRIVVFDKNGVALRTIGRFGTPLALADDGPNIGYPDPNYPQKTCYDIWGSFYPQWAHSVDRNECSNDPGDKLGFFYFPTDVAVNPDGNSFVVADAGNYRIQFFTRHDTQAACASTHDHVCASDGSGWDVKELGEWGTDVGQFQTPWGIAQSPTGRIAVSELENSRITLLDPAGANANVFTSDFTLGYRANTFGHQGEGNCPPELLGTDPNPSFDPNCHEPVAFEFNSPADVAIDPTDGRIVVADTDNNRVQVFDATDPTHVQNLVILGRPDGELGAGTPNDGVDDGWPGEEFKDPWGVAVDGDGRIYVADYLAHRIQIFSRTALGGYKWESAIGTGQGVDVNLVGPSGVVVAPKDASTANDPHWLFIVDKSGHRIARLDPARLTITSIAVEPLTFRVGDSATLRVRVKNTGVMPVTGVLTSLESNSGFASWPLQPPVGSGCHPDAIPGDPARITCDLGVGQEQEFDYTLTANAPANPWKLTASASGNAGVSRYALDGTPIYTRVATSAAVPDIVVSPAAVPTVAAQLFDPPAVQADVNAEFTVQVSARAGDVDLTNVRITLVATGPAAIVSPAGGTDTIAALTANATATSMFTVKGTAIGQVTLQARVSSNETDPDGNTPTVTGSKTVNIVADSTAPTVGAVPSGTMGDNGWFKGFPVTVTITAGDPTGVRKIWYWSDSINMTPEGRIPVNVSGTSASIAPRVPGEGETRIAFWAEDTLGNANSPTATETLLSYCARLPGHCISVKIDTLPPSLTRDSVVISADKTEVRVHFSTNDAHSTVQKVCLSVPAPTTPDCLSGVNARIQFDAGSTTNGTLILSSPDHSLVYGTVKVWDWAGYTAQFQLPFATDYGPQAKNDQYFTHATLTVPASAGVRVNDIEPFGQTNALTVTQVTRPGDGPRHAVANGLTINADGSFTYTPVAGYVGPDDFEYKVTNASGVDSNVAQVNINVVNIAPIGVPDTYSMLKNATLTTNAAQGVLGGSPSCPRNADGSVGVPTSDCDPDGDPITVALVTPPANGNVTLNADGSFTYTPNQGFAGVDRFTYRTIDGFVNSLSALSNLAQASITVIDRPPVAVADSYTTHKTLTVPVASGLRVNDSDPDDSTNTLTTQVVTQPAHGSLALSGDGSFIYAPTPGYVGNDTFTYRDLDPNSAVPPPSNGISSPATVTITITNVPPTASNNAYTAHKTLTVLAANGILLNDSDGDTPPDTLTAQLVSSTQHGTLTLQTDGTFVYVPNAGFTGTDTFTYTAFDGYVSSNVATVTINVTNQPPVAVNDAYTLPKNVPSTIDAANGVISHTPGTDSDSDGDTLTAVVVAGTTHGILALNANGSFLYTPSTGYVGQDQFTYTVTDGYVSSNIATVTLTIANQAPVAVNDAYTATGPLTVDAASGVRANDSDADDLIGLVGVELVGNAQHGALTLLPTGGFTYVPATGFHGADSFTYRLNDGAATNNLSNVATVTITVGDAAPVAVDDAYQTHGKLTVSAVTGVRANDSDPDDALTALTVSLVSRPATGSLTLNADGSFVYTPAGVGTVTFTYRLNDGTKDSNVATVTITNTNRPPVAVDDAYQTHGTLTVPALTGVRANDSDPDDALTTLSVSLVTAPSNGTLTLNTDGSFTYVPAPGFTGTDTFTYRLSDGQATSNVATVTLVASNTPPVAANDVYTVAQNGVLTITIPGLLANDSDANGDPLTAIKLSDPAAGTITAFGANGSFTYVPTPGTFGPDSFTYKVNDGMADSNVATVTITVNPATSGPFTTFTQGGWGTKISGHNPGWLLSTKFTTVYPTGYVVVGGTNMIAFTGQPAIDAFLPAGGTAAVLKASALNPLTTAAGVLAGQVLALRINVDFSNAGVTRWGLGNLKVASGPLAGYTVNQVLNLANSVLGGSANALPKGMSITDLNTVCDNINKNYDNGKSNNGYLIP